MITINEKRVKKTIENEGDNILFIILKEFKIVKYDDIFLKPIKVHFYN